jgi:hypothetical protein
MSESPAAGMPRANEGVTLARWLAARVAKATATTDAGEAIIADPPSSFSFS